MYKADGSATVVLKDVESCRLIAALFHGYDGDGVRGSKKSRVMTYLVPKFHFTILKDSVPSAACVESDERSVVVQGERRPIEIEGWRAKEEYCTS